MEAHTGKTMAEITAWTYLRRLGFALQGPHPRREGGGAGGVEKKLAQAVEAQRRLHPEEQVEVWSQDEARLGLKPIVRRVSRPAGAAAFGPPSHPL